MYMYYTSYSDWYIDLLMFTIKQVADKKAKKKLTTSLFTSWHDCCSILFNEHLTNTDIGKPTYTHTYTRLTHTQASVTL